MSLDYRILHPKKNSSNNVFRITAMLASNQQKTQQFPSPCKRQQLKKYRQQHLDKIKHQISELIYKQYQTELRQASIRQFRNSYELGGDIDYLSQSVHNINKNKRNRYNNTNIIQKKKKSMTRDSNGYYIIDDSKSQQKSMLVTQLENNIIAGEKKIVTNRSEDNKFRESKEKQKNSNLPKINSKSRKNKAKFTHSELFDGKFQPWRGGHEDFEGF